MDSRRTLGVEGEFVVEEEVEAVRSLLRPNLYLEGGEVREMLSCSGWMSRAWRRGVGG